MKRIAFLLLLLVPGTLVWADARGVALLRKVDAMVTFDNSDFSALYTIVQYNAGEGSDTTQAVIFRRDIANEYLIFILSPLSSRGKGYLKIGDDLWLYDPVARTFTLTSAKARFRNSNARDSDFTRSNFAGDYDIVKSSHQQLGPYDCTVLDLRANNNGVSFPITKLWIDQDSLVRMKEDYSLSGQLLRTTLIPTYQQVGNRYVPRTIIIVDDLKGKIIDGKFVGNRTQITITKPSLAPLPNNLFTKEYVEKISQ